MFGRKKPEDEQDPRGAQPGGPAGAGAAATDAGATGGRGGDRPAVAMRPGSGSTPDAARPAASTPAGSAPGRGGATAADAEVLRREFDGAGAHYVVVSDDPAEADELLTVRRAAFHAYEHAGNIFSEDVGVPRSKLPEMFARIEAIATKYGVDIPTCAHAGDGNLHPTLIYPRSADGGGAAEVPQAVWDAADEVFRAALDLGGTLTGEHGVGVLKARWVGDELSADVLDLHRGIKAVWDPKNLLNPGRGF